MDPLTKLKNLSLQATTSSKKDSNIKTKKKKEK